MEVIDPLDAISDGGEECCDSGDLLDVLDDIWCSDEGFVVDHTGEPSEVYRSISLLDSEGVSLCPFSDLSDLPDSALDFPSSFSFPSPSVTTTNDASMKHQPDTKQQKLPKREEVGVFITAEELNNARKAQQSNQQVGKKRKGSDNLKAESKRRSGYCSSGSETTIAFNGSIRAADTVADIDALNEKNLSPAELKRLKKEKKKARNRQLAAESRERRKQKMIDLESENKRLKEMVRELKEQMEMYRSLSPMQLQQIQEKDLESDDASVTTDGGSSNSVPSSSASICSSSSSSTDRVDKMRESVVMKGAAAMGVTMSMVMFTDSSAPGSPVSEGSFEMISFWAVGVDLLKDVGVSLSALVPHFLALVFGLVMTVSFVSLYYFRTLQTRKGRPAVERRMEHVTVLPTRVNNKCASTTACKKSLLSGVFY